MTAITHATQPTMPLAQPGDFTQDQVQLIKQTVAAGTTDLELALFLEVARSSGLNPFQRQIYAVMRYDARTRGNKMVIQTGIDGYRLIAARSGVHLGTTDPEFGPVSKEGFPEYARVIVRKLVHGQVAEFPATARWSEYVQTGKEGVTSMWKRMPHTMLGKCAEALALRKAFPAELSGVYSDVEMAQADNGQPAQPVQEAKLAPAGPDEIEARMKAYGPKLAARREAIKKYGITDKQVTDFLADLPDWRASDENAERAVSKLTEWGTGLKAAQVSEPETPDVVDAELKPVPEFDPQPTKRPEPTDPIGTERAQRLHKYLGTVVKGTEYQGKHDVFAGEALGREITHLQDITNEEARLLNDYIDAFKDAQAAQGEGE